MRFILTFLFFIGATAGVNACSLSQVKAEVAKFHGPEWNELLSRCNKSEIKKHLKDIIQSPESTMPEFDTDLRKFLYRNAVKSFGHFANKSSDVDFLGKVFNDDNKIIKDLFGSDAKLFRINILESMANTGNLAALDFFQSILEDESSVLYLKQNAAEFATWILNGSPFKPEQEQQGTHVYSEVFYPNISDIAERRFDDPRSLDKLAEKKDELKKIVADMLLQKEKYKDILGALNNLWNVLSQSSIKTVKTKTNDSIQNFESVSSVNNTTIKSKNKSHNLREIASSEREENSSEKSSNLALYFIIFLTLFLGYKILKSKKG